MTNYRKLSRIVAGEESDDPKIREEVVSWLQENPNPEDEDLHTWAEGKGYNVHEVEDQLYKLATSYCALLSGGRSAEQDFTEDEADPEQLKMGIEVELEHTDDKDVAKKIALDHLAEMDDYYTKLKEMEGK